MSEIKTKKNKFWKIQHPTVFQGKLHSKIYFEGWYYKLCSVDHNSIYAVIPGIAINKNTNTSHAFIQILDGKTADYHYIRFPLDNFSYSIKPHEICIGPNKFSINSVSLNLQDENISISGNLEFNDIIPLPFKRFSPGVMGPLSYFPFMQTYHGVVSMNHELSGKLNINGTSVNFDGGKGYTEKDWGSAFPSEWIWMQSNHFEEKNRSFIFSVAKIPYLGLNFTGFLALLWDNGKFYKFTSYNGSKLRIISISNSKVSLQLINKRKGIAIDIDAKKTEDFDKDLTAVMKTPVNGEMVNKTAETMSAIIDIHVYSYNSGKKMGRKNKVKEFNDRGKLSGLEIMADQTIFR